MLIQEIFDITFFVGLYLPRIKYFAQNFIVFVHCLFYLAIFVTSPRKNKCDTSQQRSLAPSCAACRILLVRGEILLTGWGLYIPPLFSISSLLDSFISKIYGRIRTVGEYPNSMAASKLGHILIHSLGSTIPLSFRSGDVSRWPRTSIMVYSCLSLKTSSRIDCF